MPYLKKIFDRFSHDIDIFISDMQLLEYLSPKFDEPENLISYEEYNGTAISLKFPEGNVDFIASPQLTKYNSIVATAYNHRNVKVEHPIEILAKKLYYRGTQLKARDIFDFSTVFVSEQQNNLIDMALSFKDQFKSFKNSFLSKYSQGNLKVYSKLYPNTLLPNGKNLIENEIDM